MYATKPLKQRNKHRETNCDKHNSDKRPLPQGNTTENENKDTPHLATSRDATQTETNQEKDEHDKETKQTPAAKKTAFAPTTTRTADAQENALCTEHIWDPAHVRSMT